LEVVFRDESLARACNKREQGDLRWGRSAGDVRLAFACLAAAPRLGALVESGLAAEFARRLVFRGQVSDIHVEHETDPKSGALAVLTVTALETEKGVGR
jgi:hypothetical protein